MLNFYTETLGLTLTETIDYKGHTCHFLRANTEHHSLALYPIALREELGLSEHTSCMSFGLQVANYRQLLNAVDYLEEQGANTFYLPAELAPGIDYSMYITDPDGHAFQLYHYMEQIGWNGIPRPADQRRPVTQPWPQQLDSVSDDYAGEPFLGPWR